MRMPRVSLVLSFGLLSLAGCSRQESTAPDLKQSIQAQLNADPQLQAANLDVDANAKDNKVTLAGTVPTENLRTRAVEMAKSVRPNVVVTDKIEVKPKELSRSEYTDEMARAEKERGIGLGHKI